MELFFMITFFTPDEIYLNFDCVKPTDEEIGLDFIREIHDDNIYCEIYEMKRKYIFGKFVIRKMEAAKDIRRLAIKAVTSESILFALDCSCQSLIDFFARQGYKWKKEETNDDMLDGGMMFRNFINDKCRQLNVVIFSHDAEYVFLYEKMRDRFS